MAAPSADDNMKRYRALVIDSGPIIKLTGISALREKAEHFFTVPAVLQEIRDAKAREHLQNLPFDIVTRDPSPDSIQAVTDFARLSGDFRSLSQVDISVLALVYELEKEGCEGDMDHIRTKPKRTLGVGKVQLLNPNGSSSKQEEKKGEEEEEDIEYDIAGEEEDDDDDNNEDNEVSFFEAKSELQEAKEPTSQSTSTLSGPKSWAMLVNPSAASKHIPEQQDIVLPPPGQLNLPNTAGDSGQFSDAEEEEEDTEEPINNANEGEDEAKKVEQELQKDFPSLAASLHVPFEGEDHDIKDQQNCVNDTAEEEQEGLEEQRKKEALKPLSKSGKTYNSFRGYGKLFKPAPPKKKPVHQPEPALAVVEKAKEEPLLEEEGFKMEMEGQSRIIGGVSMSGQDGDIEDDGQGWVTCTRDIRSLQAAGTLAPPKNDLAKDDNKQGPPLEQRTACATTDFAMQNVLLQMNLELLSVDGIKIRRLKNWVTRCGACFKVYTKNDDAGPHGMKRLFCERCGSDMLQRVAASVDGKTGRLKLHMSKKYKNSTRGTKYSLPKPGTGNRFQGDLLLREDQLMMGAWNQKVKMRSGGKANSAAQSMFGQDIAANVGCKAKSMNVDDIAAGFGRRNPNSTKGGRERRGKKKKSKDKACGLRRYH